MSEAIASIQVPTETILLEHSKSVAGISLPLVPSDDNGANGGSILLFYQYKEPPFSSAEHKKALKKVIAIARFHNVTGRGRVAPEGLNCTLSCASSTLMRAFVQDLREYDAILFGKTDFKITDGIPSAKLFKSLSIRKTDELVAYGLDKDRAPSLEKFAGTHLEAIEYHEAMQDKDAVIIDVRNAYESAIGRFQPPEVSC
jgi:predicted sulfurtransferase